MTDSLAQQARSASVRELPADQRFLLDWLSKEDVSAYGECHGSALDALKHRGLVRIHEEPPTGWTVVSLTDAGRAALTARAGE